MSEPQLCIQVAKEVDINICGDLVATKGFPQETTCKRPVLLAAFMSLLPEEELTSISCV